MQTNKRLARGLSALLQSSTSPAPDTQAPVEIEIDQIRPNPYQPRADFDKEELDALVQSIKECGLLQPIVVRQNNGIYEIVVGERRYRAAQILGLHKIPCIVSKVDDNRMLLYAMVENINRKDLNPIEKAKAFEILCQRFGYTHEEIGKVLGLERSSVSNFIRLLELPDEVKDAVSRGTISMGHARALLSIENRSEQIGLLKRIIKEGLSVRQVERITSRKKGSTGKTKTKDGWVLVVEQKLGEFFGAKVNLQPKGKGGIIIITYFNDQQLQDILSRLGIVID